MHNCIFTFYFMEIFYQILLRTFFRYLCYGVHFQLNSLNVHLPLISVHKCSVTQF
jgi:hypothetical protein